MVPEALPELGGRADEPRPPRSRTSGPWTPAPNRRLLRPDVRLPRLDHRLRLVARSTQRRRGRRTRIDHLLDPCCGDAHVARARLRRARRCLSGGRRTGRFPYFSHGPLAGFIAGWTSWLQAVFIAPIEVLAAITYVNSINVGQRELQHAAQTGAKAGLLNGRGLVVAVILMILFTAMNLAGAKFMSESNVARRHLEDRRADPGRRRRRRRCHFHPGNFTAGGGFMPFGLHGVFAALTGGVVFALQGFEQRVQLAGEAKNPKRDLSRARSSSRWRSARRSTRCCRSC